MVNLTNSDKFNIYSAFETINPEKYYSILGQAGDMLIDEFFDYLAKNVDLTPLIDEYLKIDSPNERGKFWLRFK